MQQYQALLKDILNNGIDLKDDRTGHGRRRVFGRQTRFDISDNKIPVVTTRKIKPETFIAEMLFFIKGKINIKYLHEHGVKIWDHWALTEKSVSTLLGKLLEKGQLTPEQAAYHKSEYDKSQSESYGDIGPMYGRLWRHWPVANLDIPHVTMTREPDDLPSDFREKVTEAWKALPEEEQIEKPLAQFLLLHYYSAIDQLNELLLNLNNDPYSSRHVVTAFSPEYTPVAGYTPDENILLQKGCLMPCHNFFQVFVEEIDGEKHLSLCVNIRSWDVPVGGPFNIGGYALLAHLLAHCTGMKTKELIVNSGDTHIYLDQIDGVVEQIQREPKACPTIKINPEQKDLFQFEPSDITIEGYEHHDPIKYPVAV